MNRGTKGYQFNKEQREELEAALAECKNTNCMKRLQILVWRANGRSREEVAALSGFHKAHISTLVGRYMKEGIESVATERRKGGQHRNLSDEQESELLRGFTEQGEKGQVVTAGEIRAKYEALVGRKIGNGTIYRMLKRNGWRKVMPRGQHPKAASEEAIEASKKLTFGWTKQESD